MAANGSHPWVRDKCRWCSTNPKASFRDPCTGVRSVRSAKGLGHAVAAQERDFGVVGILCARRAPSHRASVSISPRYHAQEPCMGTTVQKDLDWIGRAPLSFSGSATTTASPEVIFAILADHERWPEWFPVITRTEVLGSRREQHHCHLHHLPRSGVGVTPALGSNEGVVGKATRQRNACPSRPRRGAL